MYTFKNFTDFVKETETLGSDEIQATKPTALSEALYEKLKSCMEMAEKECGSWHNDKSKDHTAESYLAEYDSLLKKCYEELKAKCEGLINTPSAPDGDMRQGNTQDLN